MLTRRTLLAGAAFAATPAFARTPPPPPSPAAPTVDEEAFWRGIQREFTLDRTLVNFNNGGCCPTPRVVHEALKRYLDISNQAPVHYMWNVLEPGVETVRREIALLAGADPEEIAITRNASEALQTAQLGLTLAPGDEVLTTDQDYPRMLDTWEQRVVRDGIVLKKLSFPVPLTDPAALVKAFEAAITPRTKVIHASHVVFLTGQALPVAEICAMARARGIVSIVDGAHAFVHMPTDLHAMGCDYYGTSLHKWLLAPVGTGFLYVRKERIADHWPLTPANASRKADIRKFEEIGTHPAANHDAIAEAIAFHHGMGLDRKRARLLALRKYWVDALRGTPKLRFFTPEDPTWSGAIQLFGIEGKEPAAITGPLWDKWRILATPIVHAQFQGVRVTPNVYTTWEDLDQLVAAIRTLAA